MKSCTMVLVDENLSSFMIDIQNVLHTFAEDKLRASGARTGDCLDDDCGPRGKASY